MPTGPLAWITLVEIPTSAPKPYLKPSANLVDAFTKTPAEFTFLIKIFAVSY